MSILWQKITLDYQSITTYRVIYHIFTTVIFLKSIRLCALHCLAVRNMI